MMKKKSSIKRVTASKKPQGAKVVKGLGIKKKK